MVFIDFEIQFLFIEDEKRFYLQTRDPELVP